MRAKPESTITSQKSRETYLIFLVESEIKTPSEKQETEAVILKKRQEYGCFVTPYLSINNNK